MSEQRRRRFRADARHAGNVVDGVAGQCKEIDDLIGPHAEPLFHAVAIPAHVARKIPLFVVDFDQLTEVLVGGDDDRAKAVLAHADHGAADQIVGFVVLMREHAQAQRRGNFLAVRELPLQFVRRQFAVGLVVGINRVAERTRERFVERDHRMRRFCLLEKIAEKPSESVHRIDRCAFVIVKLRRNRMPRAEHVQAAVNQIQRAGRAHPRHSLTMSASRRPRSLRYRLARRADVHEGDDALVRGKTEQRGGFRIVGRPAREPLRGQAHRLRADQQVVSDAAGRQNLLLHRNLRIIVVDAGDHHDDQRRERITFAVLGQFRWRNVRLDSRVNLGQAFAEPHARIAAYQQHPPRREFAVIGHADRGAEQLIELFGGGPGFAEIPGRRREALIERGKRIVAKHRHCHANILAVTPKLG